MVRLLFNKVEDFVKYPDYKHKLEIFSDGNDDYRIILPEYYHSDCLCYGQKIKTKDGIKIYPPVKRKIFGNPNIDDIDTNISESFNSILRESVSRLVRRTKCHAKNKHALNNALTVFQFYWNFMHEIDKKLTPAILEHQATKIWTWGNFLHAKLTFV